MQKILDGEGNNNHKIFTSRVEEGNVSNTISYVELVMNTIKIRNNFCNGYQYEIQKRWDGGGNNNHKIFTSHVKERNIPNIMPYKELFMTPMKMKNNFCNGNQYEMQKSTDGGGNNAYKIIMCRVEERNIIRKHNLFGAVHSYNEMKKNQFSESSKK